MIWSIDGIKDAHTINYVSPIVELYEHIVSELYVDFKFRLRYNGTNNVVDSDNTLALIESKLLTNTQIDTWSNSNKSQLMLRVRRQSTDLYIPSNYRFNVSGTSALNAVLFHIGDVIETNDGIYISTTGNVGNFFKISNRDYHINNYYRTDKFRDKTNYKGYIV